MLCTGDIRACVFITLLEREQCAKHSAGVCLRGNICCIVNLPGQNALVCILKLLHGNELPSESGKQSTVFQLLKRWSNGVLGMSHTYEGGRRRKTPSSNVPVAMGGRGFFTVLSGYNPFASYAGDLSGSSPPWNVYNFIALLAILSIAFFYVYSAYCARTSFSAFRMSLPASWKKFFTLPFFIGILVGTVTTGLAAGELGSSFFRDVQPGAYYDAAVGRLYQQGIVKGGADGLYHPGDFVTRADVAVMIDRAINGATPVAPAPIPVRRSSSSSSSVASSSSSAPVVAGAGSIHFTTSGFNVAVSAHSATIAVVRTDGNQGTVSVKYAFSGGTAMVNSDYIASAGTLTFGNGETSKNISVNLNRNGQPTKTLNVTLSSPGGGAALGSPSSATLTILGNTASSSGGSSSSSVSSVAGAGAFGFSASAYGLMENGGSVTVTVLRSGGSTGAASINYATSDSTAKNGKDYTTSAGTLNFAAGETSKTFTIAAIDNGSLDGNRTVNLTLSAPTGGAGIDLQSTAILTIVDDEANASSSGSTVQFSTDTYIVYQYQKQAIISVQRFGNNKTTVSVSYAVTNGSAAAGSDYTATSGTMTFQPGETTKTFIVPILTHTGSPEVIANMSLSSPAGASLGSQPKPSLKIPSQ